MPANVLKIPHQPLRAVAFMLLFCLVSLALRQDGNWDLRNYHLYNGWAWIQGRFGRDLYVSGIQSYLNPLPDALYAALALGPLAGLPRLLAALAGLPAGVLAWLVWEVCAAMSRRAGGGTGLAALMALIGLTGSTFESEIGTTFNDITLACFAVAAILALIHGGRAGLAGLLLGLAAGLKLTMFILAPAGLFAVVLIGGRLRAASLYCLAWGAGLLIADGWWGWSLWQRFGNPVFPMVNGLFDSPWFDASSGRDARYHPVSLLNAIFFPFTWLNKATFVISEIETRDARFAAAWLGMPILLWLGARGRLPRPGAAIAGFIALGFIAWEAVFGIIRYAMALEVLIGIPIALALWGLKPRLWPVGLAALLLLASTNYPGYGRLRGWRTHVIEADAPRLPDGALLVVAGKPLAFLAPLLAAPGGAVIGLPDVPANTRLEAELRTRLATAAQAFALLNGPVSLGELARFGGTATDCAPVPNALQPDVTLCRVVRR
jgi:hypothetical protein